MSQSTMAVHPRLRPSANHAGRAPCRSGAGLDRSSRTCGGSRGTWRILPVLCLALVFGPAWAAAPQWEEWEFQGDPVAYRVDGEGPAVVQIHGLGAGASSRQTRYQIDALVASGRRVYSIDLTGWGESIGPQRLFTGPYYADLVTAFLEEVVDGQAALIGHSLGGTYAIAAAAARPELVTALVLNAPVGVETFAQESNERTAARWQRLVESPEGQAFYRLLGSLPSIALFCRTSLYVDPSFCDAETLSDYRRYTREPDSIYAAAAFLTGNLGLPVGEDFASLPQPILLIWGRENVFTPLSEADAFLALNPGAALAVIDDAGAMVNDERQQEFDGLVLDLLDGPAAIPE